MDELTQEDIIYAAIEEAAGGMDDDEDETPLYEFLHEGPGWVAEGIAEQLNKAGYVIVKKDTL